VRRFRAPDQIDPPVGPFFIVLVVVLSDALIFFSLIKIENKPSESRRWRRIMDAAIKVP
jgi:hypothetical protein